MSDSKKKLRILVAEDNDILRKAVCHALEAAKMEPVPAVTGVEALEKITEGDLNLVLIDLVMPGKTGYDVLREKLKLKDATPVFVYSNLFSDDSKEQAISLGAREYFVKSETHLQDLVDKIREAAS